MTHFVSKEQKKKTKRAVFDLKLSYLKYFFSSRRVKKYHPKKRTENKKLDPHLLCPQRCENPMFYAAHETNEEKKNLPVWKTHQNHRDRLLFPPTKTHPDTKKKNDFPPKLEKKKKKNTAHKARALCGLRLQHDKPTFTLIDRRNIPTVPMAISTIEVAIT